MAKQDSVNDQLTVDVHLISKIKSVLKYLAFLPPSNNNRLVKFCYALYNFYKENFPTTTPFTTDQYMVHGEGVGRKIVLK